jgi:hypothetical protein
MYNTDAIGYGPAEQDPYYNHDSNRDGNRTKRGGSGKEKSSVRPKSGKKVSKKTDEKGARPKSGRPATAGRRRKKEREEK